MLPQPVEDPNSPSRPTFSLVVPVLNEQESIPLLYQEIVGVMDGTGEPWELLFVDDGSTDESVAAVRHLVADDERVQLVKFVRNFGKSAAYMAAFERVRGHFVVTLDADLQDDPHEIPKLHARLIDEKWDLVVGWKQGRAGNEPHKAIPSKVFNGLIAFLFGLRLHDSNCGFRIMRLEVAKSLELRGDQYRFIPEYVHVQGYRVTEQGVNHRKRQYGYSKYGPKRFWTGLLDLITARFMTAFNHKPLHFFGTVGLVPFIAGGALEMYVLVTKLLGDTFQEHVAAIVIGVLFVIMGFQCILTGLIGEMLSAQHGSRLYQIDERSQA